MREMTNEETYILGILQQRKGKDNAITCRRLAVGLFGGSAEIPSDSQVSSWMRRVRKLVNNLIFDFGIPIIGDHRRGYYLVETVQEMEVATSTLTKHALHELWKASRLKKVAPAELLGQLTFDFHAALPVGADAPLGEDGNVSGDSPLPAHLAAVTSILAEYERDPEKYADEIQALRKKYSPMFLSREDAQRLKEAVGAAAGILEKIL